jgi:8-oxo-dGTP diphosphatase
MTKGAMRNIVNAILVQDDTVLLARRSPHRSTYPGLWSFPGGHVEHRETLVEALVREIREEVGVVPTRFCFLVSIADPHASKSDPATYHLYRVIAWEGGQPALHGGEHSELRWFTPDAARALPDLALEEYRPVFGGMLDEPRID